MNNLEIAQKWKVSSITVSGILADAAVSDNTDLIEDCMPDTCDLTEDGFIKMTAQGLHDFANRVLAGQVAPQATEHTSVTQAIATIFDNEHRLDTKPQAIVEHMENIHELAKRLQSKAYNHGNADAGSHYSDNYYRSIAAESDEALGVLINACEAIATPPTSKSIEPQRDRNADQIMAALREAEDESLLSFSAREIRGVLNLLSSERFMHKTVQERLDALRLSTSKADTRLVPTEMLVTAKAIGRLEGRESALEDAAKAAEETDIAEIGRGHMRQDDGSQTRSDIVSAILALKSATPSTIKAEPKTYSTDTMAHSVGDTESVSLRAAEVLIKSGLKTVRDGFKAEPTGDQL